MIKVSKARHRGDILEFTIKNDQHLSVSSATFYLFVHGEDWISENEPTLLARLNSNRSKSKRGTDDESSISSITTSSVTSPIESDETVHKSPNNNKQPLSISINRFVHRHPQQVT